MSYKLQSIVIPKEYFTLKDAEDWIVKHNYKLVKVDETPNEWRFRQLSPSYLKKINMNEYRTKTLNNGVMLILGYEKIKEGGKLNNQLVILELFKGTGSIGKIAKKLNLKGISLDFEEKYEPDILTDILEWDYKKWSKDNNFKPNLIWASPPCNTYSTLFYPFKERNPQTAEPYSERAKIGTKILYKTLEIINYFKSLDDKLIYVIENPRGMMRYDKKIKKLNIATTTYCSYGDIKRKPTNFFNNLPNNLSLNPIAECPNPDIIIGVQDLKTIEERYSIPPKLVKSILTQMIDAYNNE